MESRQTNTNVAQDEEREVGTRMATEQHAALFEADRAKQLRARWADIQGRFVDDPRAAVKAADELVDEVVRDLTALFNDERSTLEEQLKQGDRLSTEDLRLAEQRYRSFFERLLAM